MASPKRIGIIGGEGRMGQWFARFFKDSGCQVLSSDLKTTISSEQLVADSDIVVFSVPISVTVDVIESLLPVIRSEQLLIDLTSIKQPAVQAMLASNAEVLGLHPMFGPQIDSIVGQTVVMCKARPRAITPFIEELLVRSGVLLCQSTPEEHDKMMAIIQGLNHFMALVMADCFRRIGVDIGRSLDFSSPIYRMRMAMVGRVLAQDPRLYAEIEILNPASLGPIGKFIESAKELAQHVKDKNIEGFIDYFNQSAEYLGDFKDIAMSESNHLIELLHKTTPDPARTIRE